MPDWSGKTLGKVRVERLIARGGMAEVYLGEHTTLGRKVAVKVMRSHVDQDPDTVTRFEREATVVASLRHPNIVQMYDYDLVDGQPCLVMEYVSGPSLSTYLKALHKRGEKIPLSIVAHLLQSLASAIDYAHSQHIVHRDIKPANVLLRSPTKSIDLDKPLPADVEPILTDFGLVRLLDSASQSSTGSVSGTPTYMSPEQARGDKTGPYTDIYSLGVMLYEMLAGVVPFEADSTFGVLMKHLNDPPPPIFGISSDLQAVIDRALAKDFTLRYSTAKEFADEFVAIFNGQTASKDTFRLAQIARKSSTAAKGTRLPPVQWSWITVGAVAVVAIVFGAVRFSPALFGAKKTNDQPLGQVTYTDFNSILDKATVTLTSLPPPQAGKHYEAWLLAEGGEANHNVGTVQIEDSGQGQLTFVDPQQRNLLEVFDQIEITEEPNNDPNPDQPSDQIVASFVYPPLALVHLRHLLVSFSGAPNHTALVQGLWTTTDNIDTSAYELQQAFAANSEELVREKTEEIINQLVGSADKENYRDWNNDGTIADPSDGFGMLNGYIIQTSSHAGFASQAADATEHIHLESGEMKVCLDNIKGWSLQLLDKAKKLHETPFNPAMAGQIDEIAALANQMLIGVDSNKDGTIEPVAGEGGASTMYEHAYFLADMDLLPGAQRIPPAAPPPEP